MTETRLQRIIQLAMVAMIAGTTLVVTHMLRAGTAKPVTYAVGETLDVLLANREQHTVVLFARSGCGACQRAKPLFRKIVSAAYANHYRIVLASPQAEREYASDIGVQPADVVQLEKAPPKLPYTPTLLVADANRHLEFVYVGIPGQRELDVVLRLLSR